jgi:peptidoglycan/LPS O-acetylase OafA/YrhL
MLEINPASPKGIFMETRPNARLHGLDTLRALAIVLVVTFHLQGLLPERLLPVANVGWIGVDLFFVLSGFLIGGQLLKPYLEGERPRLGEFYRRRAYRILPAYLCVLLLYFTVPAWREAPGISAWWQFCTFTWNFNIELPAHRAFSHVWSLCVEEHFYLVLPVLVLWRMRRPSLAKTAGLIAGLVLLGMAVRWYELVHVVRAVGGTDLGWVPFAKRIYYPTYSRLDGLLVGVTLALVRSFRPGWWAEAARRGQALLLLGMATTGMALWLFRWDFPSADSAVSTVLGFPLLALGLGTLVASSMSENGWLRMRVPGANLLATLAFSLYLTHKEIAHLDGLYLQHRLGYADGSWAAAAVYAATCLLAAGLLYRCVELPFMRLRDRRGQRTGEAVAEEIREEMGAEPAL